MIALDANVLVRFLVEDDKRQAAQAAALIEGASSEDPLWVSDLVLCETVWVLTTSYRFPRAEVVGALGRVLQSRQFLFPSPDVVANALEAFARGGGDFADYVIRETARAAGCKSVATFDGALLKEPGFALPLRP